MPLNAIPRSTRVTWGILLLLFLLGLAHTAHTGFFVCDDAYITFRYARNLAEHGQLVYNRGEAVEGFSNFSWTLLLSVFAFLRLNLVWVALTLSALASLAALRATYGLTQAFTASDDRASPHVTQWISFLPPLFLVVWAPYATWTAGGLETMAFTALFALALWMTFRERQHAAGCLWGAVALTRPEGALFSAISFTWLFFMALRRAWSRREPEPILEMLDGAAIFTLILGGLFLFRAHYYGELLPNTYYAKVSGIPAAFLREHGLAYVRGFVSTYSLLALSPLLIGLAFLPVRSLGPLVLVVTLLAAWLVTLITSGGDFMAMHRFFVPVLIPLSVLVALAIQGWTRFAARHISPRTAAPVLALVLGLGTAGFLLHRSLAFEEPSLGLERRQLGMESLRGMTHYVGDRVLVGRALNRLLNGHADRRTMAVGGAGAISYESQIGRAIDTFGLMDKAIARKTVKAGKFYKPGHLKQASWASLKQQQPDILCSPGIATIGFGPPSPGHRKRVLAYFRGYEYFCLRLPLSADDRGRARTNYCCIGKKFLNLDANSRREISRQPHQP